MKIQIIDWEKGAAAHIINEILMSRICKMFLEIETIRKRNIVKRYNGKFTDEER